MPELSSFPDYFIHVGHFIRRGQHFDKLELWKTHWEEKGFEIEEVPISTIDGKVYKIGEK